MVLVLYEKIHTKKVVFYVSSLDWWIWICL